MKIAILTTGRFHVLDLARELSANGHDVIFYSYVPLKRALKFGLPKETHRSLLPYALAFLLLNHIAPKRFKNIINMALIKTLDFVMSWKLEPCDVVVAMSGIYVNSLIHAKKKYGAKIYLERGSKHILSQKKILDRGIAEGYPVSSVSIGIVEREIKGYEIADKITIPSNHVEQSFIDNGVSKDKIFKNPYGVDLDMFNPSRSYVKENTNLKTPTIIFVGNWSYRKGSDILMKAWSRLEGKVKLMHVGFIGDIPLPKDENFIHINSVPQWRLKEEYVKADLMVLPSREEGLAMVILQALACGLPVVCSNQTGGEDLKQFLPNPNYIKIIPSDDEVSLFEGILDQLLFSQSLEINNDILGSKGRQELSWFAYGRRYSKEINSKI